MGAECTLERNGGEEIGKDGLLDKDNPNGDESIQEKSALSHLFNFKSYREYSTAMENFKTKLKEMITKVEVLSKFTKYDLNTDFVLKQQIENSYFSHFKECISSRKLFDIALCVYQKIGAVYGNMQNFPKQELSKITYSLIAKYLPYDENQEDDLAVITEKIIKRVNFFSEDFPFKLAKLERIMRTNKVFVFGYDMNYRINFFIKAYVNQCDPMNDDNQSEFCFSKSKQNCLESNAPLKNYDYLIYIIFIVEHVLPVLREKYNFNEQVNLIIDFGNHEANTELISFIMTYFNIYYPLGLGKIHVVNFEFNALRKNMAFRKELGYFDPFKVIIFQNQSYKFQIIKDIFPNCLPIEYGGYHNLDSYQITRDFKLDDFIEYTLSMILIKNI